MSIAERTAYYERSELTHINGGLQCSTQPIYSVFARKDSGFNAPACGKSLRVVSGPDTRACSIDRRYQVVHIERLSENVYDVQRFDFFEL